MKTTKIIIINALSFFMIAVVNPAFAQPKILVRLETTAEGMDEDFLQSIEAAINLEEPHFKKPFTYIKDEDWTFYGWKLKGLSGDIPRNTEKNKKDLVTRYGKNSSKYKGDYILFISLKEELKHFNIPGLRFLRVAVIDLSKPACTEVMDSYIQKEDLDKVMPLIFEHLNDIINSVKKDPLYIVDGGFTDAHLAACVTYTSSLQSLFLHKEFYKHYYVLQTLENGKPKSIKGMPTASPSDFQLLYMERQTIVAKVPEKDNQYISCTSVDSPEYVKNMKAYCETICKRFNTPSQ